MKKLEQTLGFYTPAFFKIYIETVNPIDPKQLSEKEQATFIHEYTHFIQDFTTLYGLSNIYNIFDTLRLFVNQIYNTRKIQLPLVCLHPTLSLNSEIRSRSWGSHLSYNAIMSVKNVQIEKTPFPSHVVNEHPQLANFRRVVMEIKTHNQCVKIEFGSLAIMESMAHLMEKFLTPKYVTQSPDYPYNIAQKLVSYICPQLSDDEIIFALCDIALQTSMPGVAFLEMLQIIHNKKTPEPIYNADDVYACFNEQFNTWHNATEIANVVYQAKEHLSTLVQGPIGFQYQKWVDNIINKAIELRTRRPAFLLDIIRGGNIQHNTVFWNFVNEIGTPLLTNSVGVMTKIPMSGIGFSPINVDVEFFQAIDYIFSLFSQGRIECPLQNWCEASGISIDANCIINPPAHSDLTKYTRFCPVGALWHQWNLGKYAIHAPILFRQICK